MVEIVGTAIAVVNRFGAPQNAYNPEIRFEFTRRREPVGVQHRTACAVTHDVDPQRTSSIEAV